MLDSSLFEPDYAIPDLADPNDQIVVQQAPLPTKKHVTSSGRLVEVPAKTLDRSELSPEARELGQQRQRERAEQKRAAQRVSRGTQAGTSGLQTQSTASQPSPPAGSSIVMEEPPESEETSPMEVAEDEGTSPMEVGETSPIPMETEDAESPTTSAAATGGSTSGTGRGAGRKFLSRFGWNKKK